MGKNDRRGRGVNEPEARRTVNVQMSLPLMDAMLGLEDDLFALCVRSGQAVLAAMLEEERTALCGPKWSRAGKGRAQRAGTTRGEVTLGDGRIALTRPRARERGGAELALPTYGGQAVAKALLSHLVERGLDASRPMLFAIDGSKALRRAIRDVWGTGGVVQRCRIHKIRNVLEHLPEEARPRVRAEMSKAYEDSDWKKAEARLRRLARSLEESRPGTASSLREGLDETLELQRLGVRGALHRTLRSTNTIENLNASIVTYIRNVKRWRGGRMILRWVAVALDHAQPRFRAVRGFSEMPKLRAALDATVAPGAEIGGELAA